MRLRGYDEETEELSEDLKNISGDIADLTKTAEHPIGISIFKEGDPETYKSTYQILKEISQIWDELSDKQRADLLEKIAGKRGGQVVAGLLENFESVDKALENMQNAGGAADAEMEIIKDSLEYKINELKETWTGMFQNAIDTGDLGNVIKLLTNISEIIANIVNNLGIIPTIVTGIATVFSFKNPEFSLFGEVSNIFNEFKNKSKNFSTEISEDLSNAFSVLSVETIKNNSQNEIWQQSVLQGSETAIEFATALREGNFALVEGESALDGYRRYLMSLDEAQRGAASGSVVLTNGIKVLKSALKGVLVGLAFKAIGVAWNWISDNVIHRSETIAKKAKEAKDAINEFKESFDSTKDVVNSVKDRYAELAQEVDNLGKTTQNQGTLSTDEYQEFLDISNQLAEKFPQLTRGYDDNGNAILNLNGSVSTITSSLENLLKIEADLANQKILEKMPDVWKGYHNDVKETNKELDAYSHMYQEVMKLINGNSRQFSAYDGMQNNVEAILNDIVGLNSQDVYKVDLPGTYQSLNKDGAYFDLSLLSDADYTEFTNRMKKYSNELWNSAGEYSENIKKAQGVVEKSNGEFASYVSTWLSTDYNYLKTDDNKKNIISNILTSTNWDSLIDDSVDINRNDWNSVSEWISNNLISAINNIDDVRIQDELQKVIDGTLSSVDISQLMIYLESQQGFTPSDPLILYLQGKLEEVQVEEQQKQIDRKNATARISKQVSRPTGNGEIESWINSLQDEDLTLLLNADIDDNTKINTKAEFDEFMDSLRGDASVDIVFNSDIVPELSSLKSGFNSGFEDIYNNIVSGIAVDADDIEGLDESIKNLSGFKDFKDNLTDLTKTEEEHHEALNKLATEYIDNSALVKNLNNENAKYAEEQLKAMGVTNAHEVVISRLANSEEAMAEATEYLNNKIEEYNDGTSLAGDATSIFSSMTQSQIQQFYNEATAAGYTKGQIADYLTSLITAGNTKINTEANCEQLYNIASAAGFASSELSGMYSALGVKTAKSTGNATADQARKNDLEGQFRGRYYVDKAKTKNATVEFTPATTSTGTGGGGGGSSSSNYSSSSDAVKEVFDWIERRIERLTTKADRWATIIEKATDPNKIDKYYKKLATNYDKQMETYSAGAARYYQEASKIGLSKKYREKVENGKIDIETIRSNGTKSSRTALNKALTKDAINKGYDVADIKASVKEGSTIDLSAIKKGTTAYKLAKAYNNKVKSTNKLIDDINEYQKWFDKYQDQLDNYLEASAKRANLAIEKAEKKIEQRQTNISVLDKKLDNALGYTGKNAHTDTNYNYSTANALINSKTVEQKGIYDASIAAQTESKAYLNSAINNVNKNIKNASALAAAKAGKEIDITLFTEGSKAYKAAVKYNDALKANTDATNDAKIATEEYSRWLVEAAKQAFDNIVKAFDQRIKLLQFEYQTP